MKILKILFKSSSQRRFEKGYFERYDPSKASFHAFLRTCLDRFVTNVRKANRRKKRAGGWTHVSLDFESAESEFHRYQATNNISPEEYFHREWARSLFEVVLEALRKKCDASGKQVHFQLFELYDLGEEDKELSYERLAQLFGLKVTDVTNYLAFARREFRCLVIEKLRELTATDEEFHHEAKALLGINLP